MLLLLNWEIPQGGSIVKAEKEMGGGARERAEGGYICGMKLNRDDDPWDKNYIKFIMKITRGRRMCMLENNNYL